MGNRFLDAMARSGSRSEAALKRLFRAASKRVHPDSSGGTAEAGGEAFIALRRDYEEALAVVKAGASGASADAARMDAPLDPPVAARSGTARPAGAGVRPPRHRDRPKPRPEPLEVATFRSASARVGASALAGHCDPYAWTLTVGDSGELSLLAERLGIDAEGAAALSTVLVSLAREPALLRRYPGLMTRAAILYRAFASWSRYRSGGERFDLAECRTRLVELVDPTVAVVKAKPVADVVAAFPRAAAFLASAWGVALDPFTPLDGGRISPTR